MTNRAARLALDRMVGTRRAGGRRHTRVGRHTSPDPRGDRLERRADRKATNRRWRPLLWAIVLGRPVPVQDHAFALARAQETVDRLPQSWFGYLVLLIGASSPLPGILPLAQTPGWLLIFAAICMVLFLLGLVICLRVQWWHRRNRPPGDDDPGRPEPQPPLWWMSIRK